MSHSGKEVSSESGLDSLSDRLQKSLVCDATADDTNKPDFRELNLGSPISPLRTRVGGSGPTVSSGLSSNTTTTTTTTATSSSSSSSGSLSGRGAHHRLSPRPNRKSDSGNTSGHSGELSVESSPTFGGSRAAAFKPTHTRSESGGSTHSSSVNSPQVNVLPTGNICPSGKIIKTGMMASKTTKTDVLGSGTGHYGHGSIMRGGPGTTTTPNVKFDSPTPTTHSRTGLTDPEELKRLGNEQYRRGFLNEALILYDQAISISPGVAAYHCNRAAVLMGLKRLAEAVKECDEAIRLDSGYARAHSRLGSLLLSLGQVENARRHICFPGHHPDPLQLQKLQAVEKHLNKCTDARRVNEWNSVLRECDSAIASGADASPQLFSCRAEALLKLHQLDEADTGLSNVSKFQTPNLPCAQTMFFGMHSEAYIFFVRAQIDMSLGRFEKAVTAIEKAGQIDPRNVEVSVMLRNVRSVARARARGNELFKSERFTEACAAYGDGLMHDPSNPVLFCNRAACWFKLGLWERSLDDCNHALHIHPNYTKAILRRAASNSKLERWAESVKDYEALRMMLPYDNDITESLFHAQVALKKSRGEEVYNMKFGGEVEFITGLEQFRAAIASTGASVVYFKVTSDLQCKQISPFVDTLCTRYPSINFLKVDVEESPAIASAENVQVVPTFKIYKNGNRVKEMICPSPEVLESSVRHYSF